MRKIKNICLILLLFISIVMAYACDKNPPLSENGSITLSSVEEEIYVGQTVSINAIIVGLSGDVTWSSSDTDVVTVGNDGVVFAVAKGTAQVKATLGSEEAICYVTVIESTMKLTFKKDTLNLFINQGFTIIPEVKVNGEDVSADFTFISSDAAIISVTEGGLVKGLALGNAKVLVKAKYFSLEKEAEIPVIVSESVIIGTSDNYVILAKKAIEGYDYNSTHQINATLTVDGNLVANPQLLYYSSNTSVVTVNNTGFITVVGGGEATVNHVEYTSSKQPNTIF